MVAARIICQTLNAKTVWEPLSETFTFQYKGETLSFSINKPEATWTGSNGEVRTKSMRDKPRFISRQLYVPLEDLFSLTSEGCSLTEQTTRTSIYTVGDKTLTIRTLQEADAKLIQTAKGSTVKLATVRGDVIIELFDTQTPVTVGSFLELVGRGFYDGLTFHRVIPGFMAQGGDPAGNGSGSPGFTIPDEADKGLKHTRGMLSMAKTAEPNTGGSQFFICYDDSKHLDGVHTVFGQCLSGMEAVDKLLNGDRIKYAIILKKSPDADKAIAAALAARVPDKE